jgi:hypothetical protein
LPHGFTKGFVTQVNSSRLTSPYRARVWIRPLVLGVLALLDLAVIALLGIQFASRQPVSFDIIVPTLVFNLFGAIIFNIARDHDR